MRVNSLKEDLFERISFERTFATFSEQNLIIPLADVI